MNYTTNIISVRYVETDQMNFVHHSNYLKYFEVARIEWLNKVGISYAQMEKDGIMMPVISASLNFKKPLYFGDAFKVTVNLKNLPKATLEFDYLIVNHKNIVICTGNTTLAFLSTKTQNPIRCPKFLLKKFI